MRADFFMNSENMSLYIRLYTNFFTHRKTAKLRASLNSDDAYWIPPRLWAYAADHQPDGDFSKYDSGELATLLGCPQYAKALLQALKDEGFVTPEGYIHDWEEHEGYHQVFSDRAKTAADARWEAVRIRKEKKGHDTSIASSMIEAFNSFWGIYPKRVSKADALKAFGQVDGEKNLPLILAALKWQIHLVDWTKDRGKFIPYPASYLRGRRWEDEPPAPPEPQERGYAP